MNVTYTTQNDLIMRNITSFYKNEENLEKFLKIITGESKISLRIIDWFVTNYSKKYFTNYNIVNSATQEIERFKVYKNYKLNLKAYSKFRFDSFCRWERIKLPYKDDKFIETTLGQCNFFIWCIKNNILEYIEENFEEIDKDMAKRNSISAKNSQKLGTGDKKTRKKREELSISASKSIKKENVEIIVKFN